MQGRTWKLKVFSDGRVYEGLSNREATLAIGRIVYGLEPFEEKIAAQVADYEATELPLAA